MIKQTPNTVTLKWLSVEVWNVPVFYVNACLEMLLLNSWAILNPIKIMHDYSIDK